MRKRLLRLMLVRPQGCLACSCVTAEPGEAPTRAGGRVVTMASNLRGAIGSMAPWERSRTCPVDTSWKGAAFPVMSIAVGIRDSEAG